MGTLKERGLAHSLKKASSKKRKKERAEPDELQALVADDTPKLSKEQTNKKASEKSLQHDLIKNANTASLTAKIIGEQEARNKRRKMHKNENLDSLFAGGSSHNAPKDATNRDFMTRGYAVNHKG